MPNTAVRSVDEYIAQFPPRVREVLARIREAASSAAPEATETISYGMPTIHLDKPILHFAAFKDHIGIYPPVREAELAERAAPYRGEKGNLRLPLDQPLPYDLIRDIVRIRSAHVENRGVVARRRGSTT